MSNTQRIVRFFLCIAIALVPIGFVAMMEQLGVHSIRSNTGWAIICSILLLGAIAYQVLARGWRYDRDAGQASSNQDDGQH